MTASSSSPPIAASALPAGLPTGLLIGGEWRAAGSGGTFAVQDPATTDVLAEVSDAGEQDGLDALTAADAAFREWRSVAPRDRSELLRAVFEAITARTDEIAAVITAEGGKPLAESRAEVAYAADYIRWFGEQAVRMEGLARRDPAGTHHQLVLRKPPAAAWW
jgi:succinate-semialdehyde dehydrogenase/glutarate-semialdehyde dehydrogenase